MTSAEPNSAFSQAVSTVSPARSSIHDKAGSAAVNDGDRVSPAALRLSGPDARRVAALVTPIASSVMTASMPLATDFSARNTMMNTISPKNPAAASVSHIGKVGERQN